MSYIRFHRFLLLTIITAFVFAFIPRLKAQEAEVDAILKEELKYIELLQQLRMPDIAEQVIAEVKSVYPEAGARLNTYGLYGK